MLVPFLILAHACTSMPGSMTARFARSRWFRSSYSDGNGDCVDVGFGAGHVGARDSKNAGGPELAFAGPAWSSFVTELRAGRFTS